MTSHRRFALVASTGGAVAGAVLALRGPQRFALDLVVTDRPCGAEELARAHGIAHERIEEPEAERFSDALLARLRRAGIDYAYLFFSRLMTGALLREYERRLVNFHPSLLPAHAGLHAFDNSIASQALVIGTTVHFVDAGIDAGPQILQTLAVAPPSAPDAAKARHRLFAQQCCALYQMQCWLNEGRITAGAERPAVAGADYGPPREFVPMVDPDAFALYQEVLRGEHVRPGEEAT